ncbi:DUF4124 domain-containing protein [Stenotrophomonas sp. SY1]|uniref:DUF4124 domain-containing protein n=1 Tax=Stenotrophomonas sp. SY1 TaxID=477235 RepID=UPI001E5713EF|nr:DUF4124 domain-containing protein [Stenotrophomonas sp. SY1]MCD9085910.1 DUF4124 domain-containing protein [Stenotrophomonas sp. SY1]
MRALPRFCCLLLLASASAGAGNLYKWKDANGVTQYSERPPTGQQYETRAISTSGTPAPPTSAATTGDKEESAMCLGARRNLELLATNSRLMHDSDGDGTPDAELAPEQRAAQKQLAESTVAAYCKSPAKS